MPLCIRNVHEHDLDSILALNNAAGPTILPLDMKRLLWLFENAHYFRVAVVHGRIAGFLVALREDAPYDSANFQWFRQRYPAFAYIDRIVIGREFRGHGLGRVFYADVTSFAELRVPVLACEVFTEPRDDISLLFHSGFGFQEVGQHVMPGVNRRVALLARELCSHAFVRETYGVDGIEKLPQLPWLADRELPPATPLPRAMGAG